MAADNHGQDKLEWLEAERQRLAQRLEQSLISQIQLIMAQLNAYEMTAQPHARLAFSVLSSLVRDLLQRTRDLQNNLHPIVLESLGLETALESLANQIERTTGVKMSTHLARLAQRLPSNLETHLFRTVENACYLAIEHHAQTIQLSLQYTETDVHIFVTDDGHERAIDHYETNYALIELALRQDRQGNPQLIITVQYTTPLELTSREAEILYFAARGLTNKQIAAQIAINPRTVKYHLDNIYTKMDVSSRTEAATKAIQLGLFEDLPDHLDTD